MFFQQEIVPPRRRRTMFFASCAVLPETRAEQKTRVSEPDLFPSLVKSTVSLTATTSLPVSPEHKEELELSHAVLPTTIISEAELPQAVLPTTTVTPTVSEPESVIIIHTTEIAPTPVSIPESIQSEPTPMPTVDVALQVPELVEPPTLNIVQPDTSLLDYVPVQEHITSAKDICSILEAQQNTLDEKLLIFGKARAKRTKQDQTCSYVAWLNASADKTLSAHYKTLECKCPVAHNCWADHKLDKKHPKSCGCNQGLVITCPGYFELNLADINKVLEQERDKTKIMLGPEIASLVLTRIWSNKKSLPG